MRYIVDKLEFLLFDKRSEECYCNAIVLYQLSLMDTSIRMMIQSEHGVSDSKD